MRRNPTQQTKTFIQRIRKPKEEAFIRLPCFTLNQQLILSEPLTSHEIEGLEIAGMCRLNEDTEVRLYFERIVKSQQKE